ncbi:MAG: flagellin lysine-N-methylase [Clostridia bacterium]|nr:flagellin lysine-N-methylase [Clostridia bacterium]
MRKIVPGYYKNFSCIADKCKHSCCVGWEIDIDDTTMCKYNSLKGDFGVKLKKNIKTENGVSCFVLGENEKCPFLNENGLCDIILNIGEEYLSQICTDHPRFRNFFSDREELGLGLCCEEACRIILSNNEKVTLEVMEDDFSENQLDEDETFLLEYRERLFSLVQDRSLSIKERCELVLESLQIEFSDTFMSKCVDELLKMEIMDASWKNILLKLKSTSFDDSLDKRFSVAFEQLLVYFIYRHLTDSADVSEIAIRSAFAFLSLKIISGIFNMLKHGSYSEDFSLLCDICRMYSSEIEYCEENTERLFDLIYEYNT